MAKLVSMSMGIVMTMILTPGFSNAVAATNGNPLLAEWRTPFQVPPFPQIKEEHFLPAVRAGMDLQKEEIAKITASTEGPTF